MEAFRIIGGKPLHGKVRISGTKNLISKLMVASTLSESESMFTNAPFHLGETEITREIIHSVGATVKESEDGTMLVHTPFSFFSSRSSGVRTIARRITLDSFSNSIGLPVLMSL